MEKLQDTSRIMTDVPCKVKGEKQRPGTPCMCDAMKPETPRKKGWWSRYVERLRKHEGDVRSCCK